MTNYTYTTERECRRAFRDEIAPSIPANDRAALDEAFNNWTDSLCKSGQISERAYNNWTRN